MSYEKARSRPFACRAANGGGHTLTRTEQTWDSGGSVWANSFRTLYSWDSLGRQYYEERQDYSGGSFANRYDITQTYDKNGNRTGYDKNVAGGYNSDYGKAYNLSYAFNAVNALLTIMDLDDVSYGCTVTCDANGNITEVDESELGKKPTPQTNYLYGYFTYDALNRLTEHKVFQRSTARDGRSTQAGPPVVPRPRQARERRPRR